MFAWIAENAVTVITALAVLGMIAFAVFALVREKKHKSGCCTGNCASCGMCCCHAADKRR